MFKSDVSLGEFLWRVINQCKISSIINQPNSAILSIGAIVQKPIVKSGEIIVGNTMKLTLACDHRTVDGATGSMFLKTLKEFIENPVSILIWWKLLL